MRNGRISNKEIQIIHIAKNQLLINDKEYRTILKTFGVSTSKDLSYSQYLKLLQKFKADGFILTSNKKSSFDNHSKASWKKQPMLKKIETLLSMMKLSRKYADSIARHMFKVDFVAWCTPAQLHSIIAALEYKLKKSCGCLIERNEIKKF